MTFLEPNSEALSTPRDGIVFFASGEKFAKLAVDAARRSMRYNHTNHLVFSSHALSDPEIPCRLFEPSQSVWLDRIGCYLQSPFERTLFLDVDCNVLAPVGDLFDLLDRYDIAAAHAPGYRGLADPDVPIPFYELNCGVMLCRTSSRRVTTMMHLWRELYERWRIDPPFAGATMHDQPAFRRAVWQSELVLYVLAPEYNWRPAFPSFVKVAPLILHGYHDDPEAIAKDAENLGFGALPVLMPHLTDLRDVS